MQLVHVSRWNLSHVRVRVRSVRAASSHNTAEAKYAMLVSSMTSIAHNSLCSTRAYHLRIDLAHDATVGERSILKISYDHARSIYQMHSNEREECVYVPS